MKEELPKEPLDVMSFAKEMSLSTQRLIRVINNMEKPIEMTEGLVIPVSEYPRLYEALVTEKKYHLEDDKKTGEEGSEG